MAVTTADSLTLMKGVLARWKAEGLNPVFICGTDTSELEPDVTFIKIAMKREITPLRDLIAIGHAYRVLRRLRPVMVDASTPKAGLLISVAAKLARVPVRLYTLRGLPLETARGWRALVYRLTEKLAAACANRIVCISASLRDSAESRGLLPKGKAKVIGAGSSNGIDVDYFSPGAV
ncbi:MAG: glycosyltransferase, partial [Verrucomicrobiota bacterium]